MIARNSHALAAFAGQVSPVGRRPQGADREDGAPGGGHPKVFISYSHDTVEHQEHVLGLADRLRADGIDAEIDQYNVSPPKGWPGWCWRQIEAADFVLMVCTETYHRRVKLGEEGDRGLGVVWEAGIIHQLIYEAGASTTSSCRSSSPIRHPNTSRYRSKVALATSSTPKTATRSSIGA